MIKSKKYYADRVLKNLQDAFPNSDVKVGEREIFVVIDDIVNALAKENFFENWKLGIAMVDDQFITSWVGANGIDVVDPDEDLSYIELPANYAALPMGRGIDEIWPQNYSFGSVKILQHRDTRLYRNNMAGKLQGELGGHPEGSRFVFDQIGVGKNYSEKFSVRLVIRDSSQISITAPYPIPSSSEELVVQKATEYFKLRRMEITDVVRDKQDAIRRE